MNGYFTRDGFPPFTGYAGGLTGTGGGGGSGDVVGPGSSTTRAVTIFADATGKVLSNSLLLTDASGNLAVPAGGYYNFDTSAIGTSGYGFRDNGGTVQFKNSGGNWTNIPSTSSSGANTFKVSFAFNSGSPLTIAALQSGDVVMITNVTITTPFSDASATLSVGVAGDTGAVLPTSQIGPGTAANYQSLEPYTATSSNPLILSISPALSNAGQGIITCLIHKV